MRGGAVWRPGAELAVGLCSLRVSFGEDERGWERKIAREVLRRLGLALL